MTVREALNQKRAVRKGNVKTLVLCKGELFYYPENPNDGNESVYPVTLRTAAQEAKWFGVPLQEV